MNYRRGFLRLYLVFSALWLVAVLGVSFKVQPDPPEKEDWFAANAPPGQPIHGPWEKYQKPELDWKPVIAFWERQAAIALVPPAICYVFGFVVIPWIGRGFRSTHL